MDNTLFSDGPALAYLCAVVTEFGPHAGSTCGFTWPERYVARPEVAVCIGLSGTHVLVWNPFAGGWFCDRVEEDDCMLDEAHRLIEGAVVPRPGDVVSAVMLQFEPGLDALPLIAAETSVPAGTRLAPAQQRAVDRGALAEDVARRLAVYAAEEATLTRA